MSTFEKSHYALGDKLELVRKGHRPPSRGFLAVNAKKMAMIATRLAQTGFYTPVEEEKEARLEMEMVRPCAKYGTAVNVNARPMSDALDQAKKSQIAAAQAIRAVSVYGETSLYSGKRQNTFSLHFPSCKLNGIMSKTKLGINQF